MSVRLLQVILQPKFNGSSIVKQKIVYKGNSLDLTDAERASLESSLPEYWHSSKDSLSRFEKYDDMYFCERYKEYFNYQTRESDKKYYKFDVASNEETQKLYIFFLNQYTRIKIARIENLYEQVQGTVGDMTYVKYSLLDSRDTLLQESDYIMLPDYPIDEEDREKWKTYRQSLRDLTDQQAWIDGDLLKIEMPISPAPKNQLAVFRQQLANLSAIPQDLLDATTQDIIDNGTMESVIKNISQVSIKFELLKGLSKMKLPMLDLDYTALSNDADYFNESLYSIKDEIQDESLLPKDWWETATSNIDTLISNINDKLSTYQVNFTINDILTSIVNDNIARQKALNLLELEEEV